MKRLKLWFDNVIAFLIAAALVGGILLLIIFFWWLDKLRFVF